MREFTAYHCDFCKKYGKQKARIKQHEATCFKNPVTKSCATCIHLKQKEFNPYTDNDAPFGDGDIWIDYIPICNEGVDVSNLENGEKKVYLRTQCPLWENEEHKSVLKIKVKK